MNAYQAAAVKTLLQSQNTGFGTIQTSITPASGTFVNTTCTTP